MLVGLVGGVGTMYIGGVLQLMAFMGQDVGATVAAGVLPFVIGDVTKIGFAFFAVLAIRKTPRGRA